MLTSMKTVFMSKINLFGDVWLIFCVPFQLICIYYLCH